MGYWMEEGTWCIFYGGWDSRSGVCSKIEQLKRVESDTRNEDVVLPNQIIKSWYYSQQHKTTRYSECYLNEYLAPRNYTKPLRTTKPPLLQYGTKAHETSASSKDRSVSKAYLPTIYPPHNTPYPS